MTKIGLPVRGWFDNLDPQQLRALVRASLRSEWRLLAAQQRKRRVKPSAWYIVWSLLTYVVLGGVSSLLVLGANSAQEAAVAMTITASYLVIITVLNIFVSFGAGFLSTAERRILSSFPITSETYFVSRAIILLVFTGMIGTAMTLPAAVMLSIASANPVVAVIASVAMMLLSVLISSLVIITLLSLLLQYSTGRKIARLLAIMSFLGTLFSLGSILLLPHILDKQPLDVITLKVSPWIFYVPTYWLGSFAKLPFGQWPGPASWLLVAALPLVAVAAFRLAAKHFESSLIKLEPTSTSASTTHVRKPEGNSFFLFRSFEGRVIWRLFTAQLRREPKFRMQILALLPITLLYFALAFFQYGAPTDPFDDPYAALPYNQLYLVALLSPLLLMESLSQTEWYKASWLFFSAPIDRSKLLLATRTIVLTLLFIPYLLLLAGLFLLNMPAAHALMHTAMIAVVALYIFEVYLLISPKLPFSRQQQQSRNSVSKFLWMLLIMVVPLGIMVGIMLVAYTKTYLFAAIFALLATGLAIIEIFVRRRLRSKLELAEFQG